MTDFSSDEFQQLLSRYETAQREGSSCYLDSDDYVDLSDYYLDIDQPQAALAVVDEGLKQHPDDDLLPTVRAGVLIYLHRFSEAEAIVETLDEDDNYDVIYLQAQLQYAHKFPDQANDNFEKWLEFVEEEWGYKDEYSRRSVPHYEDDSDDEDVDEVTDTEAEAEVRSAYLHIIMSYAELGDAERERYIRKWVEEYLKRFHTLGHFESDLAIADVCRDEGYLDLVEDIFTRLLDTDPYLSNGWTILAAAQQSNEKYEDALNSLGFALAINPDDVPALLTQAHTYYALNNYADALPAFLKYRKLGGSHSEDQYIAYCYVILQEPELAIKYWKSAYDYTQKSTDLDEEQRSWKYYEIADGLCMVRQYEQALTVIRKALYIDKANIDYRLLLGCIYLGLEDANKASTVFSEVVYDNPQYYQELLFSVAIRFLAYDYCAVAETLLLSVRDDNTEKNNFPQRNNLYAYLALAQYQQGKYRAAIDTLKEACRLTPELVQHLFADLLPETVLPQDYYDYLAQTIRKREP